MHAPIDDAALDQIFRFQALQRSAELRQRRKYRLRVLLVWLNEKVKVFGRPWLGVNCQRITADDEVLNAVFVEGGQ